MTQVSEGVWQSDIIYLNAGEEFRVRQGASWELTFGANGVMNDANIVVKTTGSYIVQFEWDGVSDTAKITLFPA